MASPEQKLIAGRAMQYAYKAQLVRKIETNKVLGNQIRRGIGGAKSEEARWRGKSDSEPLAHTGSTTGRIGAGEFATAEVGSSVPRKVVKTRSVPAQEDLEIAGFQPES